jgi:hypothetical protein
LSPSHDKFQKIETVAVELFEMRRELSEDEANSHPAVAGNLLEFVNFGLSCRQLRFEVAPNPHELFCFLPFLHVLVSAVFALTLHDPFG